jgi:hypothetical protein
MKPIGIDLRDAVCSKSPFGKGDLGGSSKSPFAKGGNRKNPSLPKERNVFDHPFTQHKQLKPVGAGSKLALVPNSPSFGLCHMH